MSILDQIQKRNQLIQVWTNPPNTYPPTLYLDKAFFALADAVVNGMFDRDEGLSVRLVWVDLADATRMFTLTLRLEDNEYIADKERTPRLQEAGAPKQDDKT